MFEGEGIHEKCDGTEYEPLKKPSNRQNPYTEMARFPLAVNGISLGDKPIRVIQNAKTPREMWDKLNTR